MWIAIRVIFHKLVSIFLVSYNFLRSELFTNIFVLYYLSTKHFYIHSSFPQVIHYLNMIRIFSISCNNEGSVFRSFLIFR